MDDKTANEYRAIRHKHGVRALQALGWARSKQAIKALDWEWSHDGESATIEQEGFTITLQVKPDYDADTSWLGSFGNDWQEGAITSDRYDSRLYRWFYPAVTQAEHRKGLNDLGMSKSVAEDLAREYVRRDMETAREYQACVLIVTAKREGIELGQDVIGGVDFSDDEDNASQAEMMVDDHGMVDSAIDEARTTLAKLKVSA